jgi:hypothetical protein
MKCGSTSRCSKLGKNRNLKVAFSAKVWWVITWIIMIILLTMVGKNFVGSIVFGTKTEKSEIVSYHDAGFSDAQSGEKKTQAELKTENPLLLKSYNKGFREGLDARWQEQKK